MKLGLDTYSYRHAAGLWEYRPRESPAMNLDHFFGKVVDLDLEGLLLADPRHLDNLEYGYVSDVRRRAESRGLYLEVGTTGTNPDHLQSMVRAAHVLGSTIVRTSLGRSRPTSGAEMERMLLAAGAELAQVLPICDRYQVSLAVENDPLVTAEDLLSLLEQVDSRWLGVSLNTANPLAVMEDPVETARALAPLVKTVRLKDYQVEARANGFCLIGCALGEGVVDLTGIIDLLRSEAPRASLNIDASLGKQAVPVLDEAYLGQFPGASARALGRTLRLVRDGGRKGQPQTEAEQGASEGEVLAAEDELVVRSVRWAAEALGRPTGQAGSG